MSKNDIRIVGLCKTFGGTEFITAAIEEAYDFLDKIVFVNSDISWTGERGNKVKPVVEAWQKENDKDGKIIHFDCSLQTQLAQYNIGYDYIRTNLDADWIMVFDTDEVWDQMGLSTARNILKKATFYNAVAAHMHTYLKSPLYRVMPPEYCKPTVFIRPIHHTFLGIRGNGVTPRLISDDLYFHHFTYVRDNEEDIFKKIYSSLIGDQEDVPMTELVDIEKWKETKWKNILRYKNLHTTKNFEPSWYQVKRVTVDDLPMACRKLPIVEKWKDK